MKECFKCKNKYLPSFFKWRNKSKGKRFSYCNNCMVEYRRLHYHKHKKYYLDKAHLRNGRIKSERARFLVDYFSKHPCVDCGNNNPIVLEFDHKDRKLKDFNVSDIVYSGSLEKVLNEINKCDVRCANCHKIRTAQERGWLKGGHLNRS